MSGGGPRAAALRDRARALGIFAMRDCAGRRTDVEFACAGCLEDLVLRRARELERRGRTPAGAAP